MGVVTGFIDGQRYVRWIRRDSADLLEVWWFDPGDDVLSCERFDEAEELVDYLLVLGFTDFRF